MNTDRNILINCSLWVLLLLREEYVIQPTWNWWTFSFLTGPHFIIFHMSQWKSILMFWYKFFKWNTCQNSHLGLDRIHQLYSSLRKIQYQNLECNLNKPQYISMTLMFWGKFNVCLIKGLDKIIKIRMITPIISVISVWNITFCICEIQFRQNISWFSKYIAFSSSFLFYCSLS